MCTHFFFTILLLFQWTNELPQWQFHWWGSREWRLFISVSQTLKIKLETRSHPHCCSTPTILYAALCLSIHKPSCIMSSERELLWPSRQTNILQLASAQMHYILMTCGIREKLRLLVTTCPNFWNQISIGTNVICHQFKKCSVYIRDTTLLLEGPSPSVFLFSRWHQIRSGALFHQPATRVSLFLNTSRLKLGQNNETGAAPC